MSETRTRVEPQVDGTYHAVQEGPHPGREELQRKKGFKTEADAQAFLDSVKPKPELAVEQPAEAPANPAPTAEEIAAAEAAAAEQTEATAQAEASTESVATAEAPASEVQAETAEGSATAVEAAASTRRKRS